jgi:hypothetical protein
MPTVDETKSSPGNGVNDKRAKHAARVRAYQKRQKQIQKKLAEKGLALQAWGMGK